MRYKSAIFKAVLFLTVVSLAVWLVIRFNLYTKQGYEDVGRFIKSFGALSALIFIAIFSLRTLILVIPYWIMVVLGGNLFGSGYGFLYSMISVFVSATIAYFISKYFGKEFVQKLIKGRLENLDEKAGTHGFKIILVMRLSSVFPFDVLNYAVGITRIRYRDFIAGTLLGILPETFSLSFMGSSLHNPLSGNFFAAIGLILLTIGVPIIYRKIKRKAL